MGVLLCWSPPRSGSTTWSCCRRGPRWSRTTSRRSPLPAATGSPAVHGTAAGRPGFAFFVKVVQSWGRSPTFRLVPEEMREYALASVPFEAEPRVYRSDLADGCRPGCPCHGRTPSSTSTTSPRRSGSRTSRSSPRTGIGLRSPTPRSCSGGSPRAREYGRWPRSPTPGQYRTLRSYTAGRLGLYVVPALHDDEIWRHPVVAAAFDDALRRDLVAAIETLPAVLTELEALPHGAAHGDACTRNLLVAADRPELALIDSGSGVRSPTASTSASCCSVRCSSASDPRRRCPTTSARASPPTSTGCEPRAVPSTARWSSAASRWSDAAVRRAAVAAVRAPRRAADPCGDRDLPAAGGRGAVRPRPRRCHRRRNRS